ncbi:L,D-transpeptidase family protein [Hymenobacter sp. DG25B]|uniref:L,D-transpeptidase family protein n=1 Tax=Hymenobacter sp. DG25B TaxID=1385664 RepID=UPI000661FE3B|nr:L,D-transpeptidase family protein [Hymenobacter sp. DG25B]
MRYLFFCLLGLLLADMRQCSSPPGANGQSAAASEANTIAAAKPPEPIGPYIQALLDTTAAGSTPAADARLQLLAGPAVRRFYAEAQPAWTLPADSLAPPARTALQLLAHADDFGLLRTDYHWPRLQALRDSLARRSTARQQARLEVYLTDALLHLMRDLHRGKLHPYTLSAREIAAKKPLPVEVLLRQGVQAQQVRETVEACQPRNREYRQLQRALQAWLRRPVASNPDSAAVHQSRFRQVAINLERWRWGTFPDSEYVLINLPAYELYLVKQDSLQRRHHVIVGKPITPSPTLSSRITHFTLAPDWHVPNSIATKELLPMLRRNPAAFVNNNYSIYNRQGTPVNPYQVNWYRVSAQNFPYTIRQSSGCDNALGNIVFRFPSPYSVYLHDTPMRGAFALPVRALSHGCIRLAQPMQLAAYLLRRDGKQLRLPSESECARQTQPKDIWLRRPLPIHIRYLTCAAEQGQLRFYPDIYRRDASIRKAFFGQSSSLYSFERRTTKKPRPWPGLCLNKHTLPMYLPRALPKNG